MSNDELFDRARNYGVIEIEQGCFFYAYLNQFDRIEVHTGIQIMDARWSGSGILVKLETGELRRYYGLSAISFEVIKYS
jgi:hypothetical protein